MVISIEGADEVFDEMSMNKFLKKVCTVDEYYAYFTSRYSNKGWDEGYLAYFFVCGLQSKIGETVRMFNPRSLSDAYHLARFQESALKVVKEKTKASFTLTSCVKDSLEVMDENVSLRGIDNICEKNVILENQDTMVDDDVEWNEEERDFVNGVAGMETDSDGNRDSNSDVMDVDDVLINGSKDDSIMNVDHVCEEAENRNELELIVSCKVDVDEMVNYEKDGKGANASGGSCKEEVSLGKCPHLRLVAAQDCEHEDHDVAVHDVVINLSKEDANRDFHEEVKNSKEWDGSLMETITEVANNKFGVMGFGKVCSEVGGTNELESQNLVKLSKEVDEYNRSGLLHLITHEDNELEKKFSSDLGVEIDCVGSMFVEVTTIVEKTTESVDSRKEDTSSEILEKHDKNVLEKKKVRALVDFGCDESGIRICSGRKVENGRGGDTFGYNVQQVLGSINEDVELLYQQKKKRGAVREVTEIQDGSFDSPGYRMCELDRWDWRKRKKPSGTKRKFKRRKWRFLKVDIWKWAMRKKEGMTDVESYLGHLERIGWVPEGVWVSTSDNNFVVSDLLVEKIKRCSWWSYNVVQTEKGYYLLERYHEWRYFKGWEDGQNTSQSTTSPRTKDTRNLGIFTCGLEIKQAIELIRGHVPYVYTTLPDVSTEKRTVAEVGVSLFPTPCVNGFGGTGEIFEGGLQILTKHSQHMTQRSNRFRTSFSGEITAYFDQSKLSIFRSILEVKDLLKEDGMLYVEKSQVTCMAREPSKTDKPTHNRLPCQESSLNSCFIPHL